MRIYNVGSLVSGSISIRRVIDFQVDIVVFTDPLNILSLNSLNGFHNSSVLILSQLLFAIENDMQKNGSKKINKIFKSLEFVKLK